MISGFCYCIFLHANGSFTLGQILEALTTERCGEHFSLERLEVLGDAFLKFVVGRHLFLKHDSLDEGQLTRKRSNIVNNSNLLKLALGKNLQVTDVNLCALVPIINHILWFHAASQISGTTTNCEFFTQPAITYK